MAGGVDIILASFVVRTLSVPNDGGWWGLLGKGRQAVLVARPGAIATARRLPCVLVACD